jgi:hypothetical protein
MDTSHHNDLIGHYIATNDILFVGLESKFEKAGGSMCEQCSQLTTQLFEYIGKNYVKIYKKFI